MGDYSYTHTCGRCAATLFEVVNADAQAWKTLAGAGCHCTTCPGCGCCYDIEDDSNPSGGVQAVDKSQPKIDSINLGTGPIAGSTVVRVNGSAFQVPGTTPTVKFGGLAAPAPTVLSDVAMDATTPAGKARLLATLFTRVLHGTVTAGPFQVGDVITGGTSGETAEVMEVGAGYLLIKDLSGPLTASETLTGSGSGASAPYTGNGDPNFANGETITGVTSGATATCIDGPGLVIQSPSGPFTAGEEITGGSSGARAQLANPTWYDGTVDVSVENDHGQRHTGGSLTGVFEFTI